MILFVLASQLEYILSRGLSEPAITDLFIDYFNLKFISLSGHILVFILAGSLFVLKI